MSETPLAIDPPRTDAVAYWNKHLYRFPRYVDLYEEEVVDGEFMNEVDPYLADESYLTATVVEDPRALTGTPANDPDPVPEEAKTPEAEQPAGVRVKWVRASDLIADVGARATGRGIDFTAALTERLTGRNRGTVDPEASHDRPNLEPVNPYADRDYRAKTPAPPETIGL